MDNLKLDLLIENLNFLMNAGLITVEEGIERFLAASKTR